MAKKQDTISIGFEEKIWKAADILRGNLSASQYEGVVLGLIFLKYISDRFEQKFQELQGDEYADPEDRLFKIRIKIWYKTWCYIGVFKLLIFNTLIYKIVL